MPVRALALLAQRIGALFASATTWARTIRERGWRRPRKRVYPPKPKVGIRATAPAQLLHIDVTIIKLLDGTRAYLHAIIDNFSRKILAWRLAPRLLPQTTCEVLAEADSVLPADAPTVGGAPTIMADNGIENFNGQVDAFFKDSRLERILARISVTFSNSMIEAWWRSLKHGWLFLNQLDTFSRLEKLIAFYVQQHNQVMPHSAFEGQTPDEVFAGVGNQVPQQLAQQRHTARQERIETNRKLNCNSCFFADPKPDPLPPPS
jgi:transposase InsO family protein